jgi:hypothetical protein
MHTQGRYSGVARTNASTCRVRARTICSAHIVRSWRNVFLNRQTCFSEKSLPCTQRKRVIFIYCGVCFEHNANTIFVFSFLCQCGGSPTDRESLVGGCVRLEVAGDLHPDIIYTTRVTRVDFKYG